MLLTSSSDRCSGLRWPAVSLRRDVVSSLSTVESEQMGGSGTKVRWGREGPCTPSTGITDSREALLAVGRTSVSSDPSVSFEGDWVVVPGRGWRIRGCFGNFKIWVFTCQGRRAGLVCFLIRIFPLGPHQPKASLYSKRALGEGSKGEGRSKITLLVI